jgi:hypothetical protein
MKPLIFSLAVLVTVRCFAATPPAGTLAPPLTSGGTSTVSWGGGPYTAVTYDTSLCTPLTCDDFYLTVNVPPIFYANNPDYEVRVGINWATNISDINDFDLYVFDASGNLVNSSTQGNTNFELVDLLQIRSGTYRVHVVAFATVNESYTGTATLGPAPTEAVRSARYKPGNFTFTAGKQLTAPNDLLFNSQDLEPRAAYDALGNIYVAAIQGMPAGTDMWKSIDGGTSPSAPPATSIWRLSGGPEIFSSPEPWSRLPQPCARRQTAETSGYRTPTPSQPRSSTASGSQPTRTTLSI